MHFFGSSLTNRGLIALKGQCRDIIFKRNSLRFRNSRCTTGANDTHRCQFYCRCQCLQVSHLSQDIAGKFVNGAIGGSANLPSVASTKICRRCQWHLWSTMTTISYIAENSDKNSTYKCKLLHNMSQQNKKEKASVSKKTWSLKSRDSVPLRKCKELLLLYEVKELRYT